MHKRILALLLAVIFLMSSATVALADTAFHDTEGHWAEASIQRWSGHGIVQGDGGAFQPNTALTCGQMAVIIAKLLNLPAAPSADLPGVGESWYTDAINRCFAAGIFQGFELNIRPEEALNREESMVMLARALGIQPVEDRSSLEQYPDDDKISNWAKGYVSALIEKGIVNGSDGLIKPEDSIDRAAAMTILDRAIAVYADQPGQTVNAENDGIVLVVAADVSVSGTAGSVLIATEGATTLSDLTVSGDVTVAAAGADVLLEGESSANSIVIAELATESSLSVGEKASVGTVETHAAESSILVSGTVDHVSVGEKAADTQVEAKAGASISSVESKAEGTCVVGEGSVDRVSSSGENIKVETEGTKVESGEGSSDSSAADEHSCSVSHWESNDDGSHSGYCDCGALYGDSCSFVDGICNQCNYLDNAAARIGSAYYASLQSAIDAVAHGQTILLLQNVTITEPAYGSNALNYTKAGSFTLNLMGHTITADTGNSVFRFNIASSGATTDVTVKIKNGTITAGSSTWCAVMAAGSSEDVRAVLQLEDLAINNSKAGDLAVKAWEYGLIQAEDVIVTSSRGAGGFYAVGGEIVLDDCTVTQTGLYAAPYLSVALAVSSGGKMTVHSGTYSATPTAASEGGNQGSSHGSWVAAVMNSGGTLVINGGTFANGNFGDDALATAARGAILVDTDGKLLIQGGNFNALKEVIDIQNNLGNANKQPSATLSGGNFSANPIINSFTKLADGYDVDQLENGRWIVSAQFR